jgi:hypothetical protein
MNAAVRRALIMTPADYHPTAGGTRAIRVEQVADDDSELGVVLARVTAWALAADLDADPIGRRLDLESVRYRIAEALERGDGWLELVLERNEAA